MNATPFSKKLLKRSEAAEFLGLSRATLYKLTMTRRSLSSTSAAARCPARSAFKLGSKLVSTPDERFPRKVGRH